MFFPNDTLVLVADGKRFILLRNAGDFDNPRLVVEGNGEKETPSTRIGSNGQTDRNGESGNVRSVMDHMGLHQREEERFAASIADHLDKVATAKGFDKLVIVAPTRTLAQLRDCFGSSLRARVIAEIAKDLTKHPVKEIAAILSGQR